MGVRVVFPDMGKDPSIQLIEKTITENGTYDAITDGANGYSKVNVNVEGGGGSWQTVFEGSVTTESESTFASGDIVGLSSLDGDSVKVTFNGVEYTLPKHELGYGEMGEGNTPDFSNYPLFIETSDTPYLLYTETAGTYTLKIEEPQSGGSSDFSTAEVTVVVDNPETFTGEVGMWLASSFNTTDEVFYGTADAGIFVENNKAKVLMCGNAFLNGLAATDDNHDYTGSIISATGNISKNGSGALARWVVIGDGTITVHFSPIMPQP